VHGAGFGFDHGTHRFYWNTERCHRHCSLISDFCGNLVGDFLWQTRDAEKKLLGMTEDKRFVADTNASLHHCIHKFFLDMTSF